MLIFLNLNCKSQQTSAESLTRVRKEAELQWNWNISVSHIFVFYPSAISLKLLTSNSFLIESNKLNVAVTQVHPLPAISSRLQSKLLTFYFHTLLTALFWNVPKIQCSQTYCPQMTGEWCIFCCLALLLPWSSSISQNCESNPWLHWYWTNKPQFDQWPSYHCNLHLFLFERKWQVDWYVLPASIIPVSVFHPRSQTQWNVMTNLSGTRQSRGRDDLYHLLVRALSQKIGTGLLPLLSDALNNND